MNTEYIIRSITAFAIAYIITIAILRIFFSIKIGWKDFVIWVIGAIGVSIIVYNNTETKEVPFKEEEWRNKWEDTIKTEKVIVDTIPRMLSYNEDITLSDGRVKTIIRVADSYDGVVQYFLINKYSQ